MKALIATVQPVLDGYRIAQVCEKTFPVAPQLFWVDCAKDVRPDLWYYQKDTKKILPVPQPEPVGNTVSTTGNTVPATGNTTPATI